ncbi:MAG: DUF2784 domain-containing protein [Methylococcaceae bacterium]|nr:DUF2784 domain-containing protein [Methylococcaceae bacterium]
MHYRWAADILLIVHFIFILFVLLGGLLVLWRSGLVWLHLPAAVWGVIVELSGWICPLTPLEQKLRLKAGSLGYEGGFVEHYLLPLIYPDELTAPIQLMLAGLVLLLNIVIYALVCQRLFRHRPSPSTRD